MSKTIKDLLELWANRRGTLDLFKSKSKILCSISCLTPMTREKYSFQLLKTPYWCHLSSAGNITWRRAGDNIETFSLEKVLEDTPIEYRLELLFHLDIFNDKSEARDYKDY